MNSTGTKTKDSASLIAAVGLALGGLFGMLGTMVAARNLQSEIMSSPPDFWCSPSEKVSCSPAPRNQRKQAFRHSPPVPHCGPPPFCSRVFLANSRRGSVSPD
jgi:hypothetical protein